MADAGRPMHSRLPRPLSKRQWRRRLPQKSRPAISVGGWGLAKPVKPSRRDCARDVSCVVTVMFIFLAHSTGIRRSLSARIRLTSPAELTQRILGTGRDWPCRPEEVAELIVWLCSDRAVTIDGGYVAQ